MDCLFFFEFLCYIAIRMFGVSSFLSADLGKVSLVPLISLPLHGVSCSVCVVVQQQKVRIMNICPELERKTTVVCVSQRERWRVCVCVHVQKHTHCLFMHTYEASVKHGHLDDVRLSSQPAVSPLPAGVSPFSWEILGFPAS